MGPVDKLGGGLGSRASPKDLTSPLESETRYPCPSGVTAMGPTALVHVVAFSYVRASFGGASPKEATELFCSEIQ